MKLAVAVPVIVWEVTVCELLTVYVPPLFDPVPVPNAVMTVPAVTPEPVNTMPTVNRPVLCVVSVNVVPEIDPFNAVVVAVVVVVSETGLKRQVGARTDESVLCRLPPPLLRSYQAPTV